MIAQYLNLRLKTLNASNSKLLFCDLVIFSSKRFSCSCHDSKSVLMSTTFFDYVCRLVFAIYLWTLAFSMSIVNTRRIGAIMRVITFRVFELTSNPVIFSIKTSRICSNGKISTTGISNTIAKLDKSAVKKFISRINKRFIYSSFIKN